MDRKLRPHVLYDLLCNLEMVAVPSSASFSLTSVQLYCMCEADGGNLTCRGRLKDSVLQFGAWDHKLLKELAMYLYSA